MSQVPRIVALVDLPADIEELRAEASGEGFHFVEKLVVDWRSGTNTFARRGEVFLGAFQEADFIAVGGLNLDPYTDEIGYGRLRHLYVTKSARRSGVGSTIVRQLVGYAATGGVFHSVRLRTGTKEAADFYVSLGFRPLRDETATHVWSLRASQVRFGSSRP